MSDESQVPPLRLVTSDVTSDAPPADADAPDATATDRAGAEVDPLATMVQRIDELPLRERPAAFDRVNANLVAELNALEEV